MVEYITDTQSFTITIKAHGDLVISNITHPLEIFEGETFNIEYDVTNNGGTDICYGKITDDDTTFTIPGSEWDATMINGELSHKSVTITGLTATLNATIDVGYIGD